MYCVNGKPGAAFFFLFHVSLGRKRSYPRKFRLIIRRRSRTLHWEYVTESGGPNTFCCAGIHPFMALVNNSMTRWFLMWFYGTRLFLPGDKDSARLLFLSLCFFFQRIVEFACEAKTSKCCYLHTGAVKIVRVKLGEQLQSESQHVQDPASDAKILGPFPGRCYSCHEGCVLPFTN